jgi:hypothetical protein
MLFDLVELQFHRAICKMYADCQRALRDDPSIQNFDAFCHKHIYKFVSRRLPKLANSRALREKYSRFWQATIKVMRLYYEFKRPSNFYTEIFGRYNWMNEVSKHAIQKVSTFNSTLVVRKAKAIRARAIRVNKPYIPRTQGVLNTLFRIRMLRYY